MRNYLIFNHTSQRFLLLLALVLAAGAQPAAVTMDAGLVPVYVNNHYEYLTIRQISDRMQIERAVNDRKAFFQPTQPQSVFQVQGVAPWTVQEDVTVVLNGYEVFPTDYTVAHVTGSSTMTVTLNATVATPPGSGVVIHFPAIVPIP